MAPGPSCSLSVVNASLPQVSSTPRPAVTSPIVWVLLSVAKLFERCRSVVSRTIWILKTQVDWALAPLFTCLHIQGPTPQQSTPGFYVRMLLPSGHIVSSVSSCSLTSVSPFFLAGCIYLSLTLAAVSPCTLLVSSSISGMSMTIHRPMALRLLSLSQTSLPAQPQS